MSIEVSCAQCGEPYQLKDSLAGKSVRCRNCQSTISVPDKLLIDDVNEYEVVDDDEDVVVARPGKGKRSRSSVKVKSGKKSRSSSDEGSDAMKWVAGCLIAGAVCFLLMCAGVGLWIRRAARGFEKELNAVIQEAEQQEREQAAARANLQIPPGGPAESLYPIEQYPVPTFPDLGPPVLTIGQGVTVHQVRFVSPDKAQQPGYQMTMHVYLPPGEAAPATRPLVIVAPAGSTLVTGNSVDGLDYHDETLPYAEAGAVVIMFSLDGPIGENEQDALFGAAYQQFRDAGAGTVNAKVTIDYALARIPSVDPRRIVIAGHSSAGTLSLLYAAHESRLAAAVAYCPCVDVETRLEWATDEWSGNRLFPGLEEFVKKSSPMTHFHQVKCPVFLFHAIDDSNTPYADTVKYHERLKSAGKDTTLSEPPAQGDHYQPMIDQGIPRAIQWLKDRHIL
ncbi:MAG: hypothetical protein DWH91_08465 [Planctomycetota bacterium]|nr:MAG: hypothetical protein DWH91_08465 [Planctomycetota bacterium]